MTSKQDVDAVGANTRSRNKSVRSQGPGSVSDISEAFKRQMASQGESKSKVKISSNKLSQKTKSNKEDIEKTRESIKQLINNIEPESLEGSHPTEGAISDNHDNHDACVSECEENESFDQEKSSSLNSLNGKPCKQTTSSAPTMENNTIASTPSLTPAMTHHDGKDDTIEPIEEEVFEATNEEIFKGLKELTRLVMKLDNDIHHPKFGIGTKLVQMTTRLDDLYTDIHGAVGGVLPQLTSLTTKVENSETKIAVMETHQAKITQLMIDVKKLTHDIDLMKNLFQKHSQKLSNLERNMLDLTRRGMEQNLVFHGVHEFERSPDSDQVKEDTKHTVITFVQENLGVEIDPLDIWKAHRVGKFRNDRARVIVVKVAYHVKELIMGNVTKLKSMKNKHDQKIFINEQQPDGIVEHKKQISARLKTLNKLNEELPVEERKSIQVLSNRIVINGEVDQSDVSVPEPADLFMNPVELKVVKALSSKIKETEPIASRSSRFVGLAVKVHSIAEANRAYKAVALRFPSVDHIMMAYCMRENDTIKKGFCDDNEHGGGNCIAQVLKEAKAKDTAVFVVRQYGGIHLGFDRFKLIQTTSKDALKLIQK